MQLLFTEIPPFYWRADFTSPIHLVDRKGMKIPYEDGIATTLRMAIQGGLYLYVAEVILQAHMRIEPTIFLQTDGHNLDPQLRLLLSMAGSPSIRNMAIPAYSFLDSLFGRILRGIGDFLGVSSCDNNPLPAVALATNRHAVLKLLYDLISSAEFDDTVTHHDQIFVLTIFFRVLNSPFPPPPFLPKDWCTPQLAIKSVQIAFEDVSQTSLYHEDYYHAAYELGIYFFKHTSFTNETLAYFVSTLFERLRKQDGRLLSVFLDLIVTGLASEQWDVQARQQSLKYLYEPENLFSSCTTLITWGEVETLRRLALLCPRDPTWSRCLRQLDVFDFPKQVLGMHDIPHTISDFKAFIETGCVSAFEKTDTASSYFTQPDQEVEDPPRHPWSTAWHRVWRFIPGESSREDMGLSNNDHGV
ncbi:hypothetical protein EDD18DRAFT_1127831 [Armillaria luteobubalina]|uniref:Uncharacterized protein n=1 Tax=Armillaria luteobubalina TaxID=153913 RepID=A0AA39UZU9_9AGAR|nr:hypothetical protein EDD18DRAFT_1127831 [Armillaria luteobubalina]